MEIQHEATLGHLLAIQEGLYELRARFESERNSSDFQEVFSQKNPLVSIVVATFNRSHLMSQRCLPSLLRQTYSNLQIVIVGDGCSDNTEEVLNRFTDSRIQFRNLPQNGPYPSSSEERWMVAGTHAMNKGLELCEGSFIAHLDDDDESSPERIERMLRQAQKERSEFLWHRFLSETPDGLWRSLGSEKATLGQITTGSVFYHRFFRKIPWDPEAYRLWEPGDWNRFRKILFLKPKCSFVDECLTIHHREQNQPTVELDRHCEQVQHHAEHHD